MYRMGERIGYPQHDRAVSLALLPGHQAYATGVIPSWTKCCTPPGPSLGSRLSLPRAGQVCLARVIAYALPHFLGFRRALSRARHPAPGTPSSCAGFPSVIPGGATGKEVSSLGREDLLEEEMATHSSILAWRIPWTRGDWWATVHRVAKSGK